MDAPTYSTTSERSFLEETRTFNGSARGIWHKTAPAAVRRAFARGRLAEGFKRWRRHLSEREEPVPLRDLLPGTTWPLAWALPEGINGPPAPAWLERARRLRAEDRHGDAPLEKDVLGWAADVSAGPADVRLALEALACAHALPWLAEILPPEVWWAVLDQLLSMAADAGAIELEDAPLAHQLLAGELPLALAYLLPEIAVCRRLRTAARRALSSGLEDLLDGEGLPHARWLALMRPLLACWTRSYAMGEGLKGGAFTASGEGQYEWLVRQSLRLLRYDGTQMLCDGQPAAWDPDLFEAALRFGGDRDDRRLARLVLPGQRKRPAKDFVARVSLPEAANHSAWAATTVLRPDWSRACPRLTLCYDTPSVRMELVCGPSLVLCGNWDVEVRLDGEPLRPVGEWQDVSWESDEDVDYLELELELAGGVQVQRQVVLAREDRFLLLADAVTSPRPGRLEYRGSLPLAPNVTFRGAGASREGVLRSAKRRALVLPLALPEWRADRRIGDLTQEDGRLRLSQTSAGPALYAPLFLDLERERLGKRRTWRQLTVAEELEKVPPEVAAGFRVAVGDDQWLIYRALASKGNRTLLGHNLSGESLVARFEPSGEVKRLVEIE